MNSGVVVAGAAPGGERQGAARGAYVGGHALQVHLDVGRQVHLLTTSRSLRVIPRPPLRGMSPPGATSMT